MDTFLRCRSGDFKPICPPPWLGNIWGYPSCRWRSHYREWQGLDVGPHNFPADSYFFPQWFFSQGACCGQFPNRQVLSLRGAALTNTKAKLHKSRSPRSFTFGGPPCSADPSTTRALPSGWLESLASDRQQLPPSLELILLYLTAVGCCR